jgi:putative ABC transport system substrate-binding protein
MKRREFITLLGGAAAVWPLASRAQQAAMSVIGFLSSTSSDPYQPFVVAFLQGLKEVGFIEGQNFTIEYRWADGQYDRLPALAADLVRRQVAVIAVGGGGITALAAKNATSTIPIVFAFGSDPVKLGLVASLNRPGGNITGASNLAVALGQKRLELLRDLLPKAVAIGFLVNPGSPNVAFDLSDMQTAAHARAASNHRERQHRAGNRHGFCDPRAAAGRCLRYPTRTILVQPTRSTHRAGLPACDSYRLLRSRVPSSRWPD